MLAQGKIEKLRGRLLQERDYLGKQLADMEAGNHSVSQSESSGENAYDEDFPDLATSTFEREKDLSIEFNVRDLLNQIDEALLRMDDGKYGLCAVCGRPIDAQRLDALPHTTLCLEDKEREERTR